MAKILVVEDNEMSREMLSRRLIRRGYMVDSAESGSEGIRKAKASRPDLILMDLDLPDLDGLEATRVLRSDESTKQIPIVVLTAHAMREERERAAKAGCDAFHTKPVDFEHLLAVMRRLLAVSAAAKSPLAQLRHDLRGAIHALGGFCELEIERHGSDRPAERRLIDLGAEAERVIEGFRTNAGDGEEAAGELKSRLSELVPELERTVATTEVFPQVERSAKRLAQLIGGAS